MTDTETINAALARLQDARYLVETTDLENEQECQCLDAELAALIRQSCSQHYCCVCTGDNKAYFAGGYNLLKDGVKHRQDCALIALCRAVVGEKAMGERE